MWPEVNEYGVIELTHVQFMVLTYPGAGLAPRARAAEALGVRCVAHEFFVGIKSTHLLMGALLFYAARIAHQKQKFQQARGEKPFSLREKGWDEGNGVGCPLVGHIG